MMKARFILFAIFLFVLVTFAQNKTDQHLLFTQILNDYIHNGLVNYKKLKDDNRLDKYLKQLVSLQLRTVRLKSGRKFRTYM